MRTNRSFLDAILVRGREHLHESWYSAGDDAGPEFIKFVGKTRKKLKIICGELDPKFYEKPELVSACDSVLAEGATIEIVFNADVGTLSDAKTRIGEANKAWGQLKSKYGSHVRLWWVPKRPVQHYAIVDERDLFLEEHNHKPYGARKALFRYQDTELATEYEDDFDEYVQKKGKEIVFE